MNLEEKLLDVVERVDVVAFREAMKEHSDQYDIAFVEGSIQRPMDEERLKTIRSNAQVLIALGDCAVTGCVNKLRNNLPIDYSLKEVYPNFSPNGNKLFALKKAKALNEIVPIDFCIRGCPVRKEQILYYIERLSWMPLHHPRDSRFGVAEKPIDIDKRSLVLYNPHKCILCGRCDTICREALGVDALGLVGKGPDVVISTPKNIGFDNNGCIKCGQCVSSCSCGALETGSCVSRLIKDLEGREEITIAIDSIALSSYIEKNFFLSKVDPNVSEKHIIGALEEAGFDKVVQYDRFLFESITKDKKETIPRCKKMLSWCKGAFNYVQERIPDSILTRSEKNAPWTLLFQEEGENSVCLLSPCTALKGVEGFKHVLSSMELDELFKRLEIDPEFATPRQYQNKVKIGKNHPGFNSIEPTMNSFRISEDVKNQIERVNGDFIDLFPCLNRCLTGGGNYPTVERFTIEKRRNWLGFLWEAQV